MESLPPSAEASAPETGQDDEAMRLRLAALAEERDAARDELVRIRRVRDVDALARHHQFSDAEYLGYLCERDNVALEDAAACQYFMDALRERSPRLFRLSLEPGAPGGISSAKAAVPAAPSGAEGIVRLLADAPELF